MGCLQLKMFLRKFNHPLIKNIMNYIKRILGITELIKENKETNDLLKEVIKLQKHNINNDCVVYSNKKKI